MKRNLLIVLIIACASLNAAAQSDFRDGFIIDAKGDTLHGKIDFRSNTANYKSCRFQNSNGIVVEYSPNELKGFGYPNDKFFLSGIANDSFVEVLVIGECNLYKYENGYFVNKSGGETYWIEPKEIIFEKGGNTYSKPDSKWKGILTFLFSDCPQSIKNINNLVLREPALVKIVKRYNECKGISTIVYKENKPWTKINIGLMVGATQSTIKISNLVDQYLYLKDRYSSVDPTVGFTFAFSSPRINEKAGLLFEPHLTKSSFSSLVIWSNSLYTDYHETHIELTTLSLPLSMQYEVLRGKYSLFVNVGGNLDYNLKWKTTLYDESVAYNTVNTYDAVSFPINNLQLGYGGGLELQKSFRYLRGGIALRYLHMLNLNRVQDFDCNVDRLSICLIIYKK